MNDCDARTHAALHAASAENRGQGPREHANAARAAGTCPWRHVPPGERLPTVGPPAPLGLKA
jgi:hypothetical protein